MTLTVPMLKLQVTRPAQTVLSVLMAFVLLASMALDTACPVTQTDIQKAENIASEVLQALPLALQLLSTFGAAIPPNVMTASQSFSQQAVSDMQLVASLLQQYQASASTTLESKINAALADAQNNLAAILTALHVVDANTVATIGSVISPIMSAIGAIEGAVAAVVSKLGAAHGAKAKLKMYATAKTFKQQFNAAMGHAGHAELGLK